MSKNQKNQSGFSAVEAILILVIVGILGFTGWFIWHAKQNADKTLTTTNSTSSKVTSTKKTAAVDSYAGWAIYTNKDYGISFQYPATWIPSDDVYNPDQDAVGTEFSTGLKLTEAKKYNNTVVVAVHSKTLADTMAFYDQYYAQSILNKVVKTTNNLKGKQSVQYAITNSGVESKLYLISVGTKSYSFASINEEVNLQTDLNYWSTFNKVFDSLQLN